MHVEAVHDPVFVHGVSHGFAECVVGCLVVFSASIMGVLWGYLRLFRYGQVMSVSVCIGLYLGAFLCIHSC